MDSHSNFNTNTMSVNKTKGTEQYGNYTSGSHGLPPLAPIEPSYLPRYDAYTAGSLPPSDLSTYALTRAPASNSDAYEAAMQNIPDQMSHTERQDQEDNDVQPFTDEQMEALEVSLGRSRAHQAMMNPPMAEADHTDAGDDIDNNNAGNPYGLHFTSAEESAPYVFRRQALTVHGDDVEIVRANQAYYVSLIMQAILSGEYLEPPQFIDKKGKKPLNESQRARWVDWMNNGLTKTTSTLSTDFGRLQAEARAWRLVKECIIIQSTTDAERGYRLTPLKAATNIKCSERLNMLIEVLHHYTIARHNLINDDGYEELCASPEEFAQNRVRQMWSNYTRDGKRGVNDPRVNSRNITQQDGLGRAAQRTLTPAEFAEKKKQVAKQKKKGKRSVGQAFGEEDAGESEKDGVDEDDFADHTDVQASADAATVSAETHERMRTWDL